MRSAYEFAARHPEVLRYVPCFCGCERERLIAQAGIEPGHRVLDLGCGTGSLLVLLKKRTPGARAVGIDADPEVLALARRKARAAGVELELLQGLGAQPPFPPGRSIASCRASSSIT